MHELRRILHPTDFSDNSRVALEYVEAFAEGPRTEVHLLHVIHGGIASIDYNFGAIDPADLEHRRKDAVWQALESLARGLRGASARIVTAVAEGTVHERIRNYVIEHEIDLVVLATHGHGGLHHLLLGSTAERVVRTAPCPVLTVKSPVGRHGESP